MKRILCYGDSNTWGFSSEQSEATGIYTRYDENTRWTSVMAKTLGADYTVIEAGLNGRTAAFDDPTGRTAFADRTASEKYNGLKMIELVFDMADPVDLIVIMLGTNDLKKAYNVSAEQVCANVGNIVEKLQAYLPITSSPKAKFLLVSPVLITKNASGKYHEEFSEQSAVESQKMAELYRTLAQKLDCAYLCAADYVTPSGVDGLHFSPEGHIKFGHVIADKIKTIL